MHTTVHLWRSEETIMKPILSAYFQLIFLLGHLTDPLGFISFPDLNEILGLLLKLFWSFSANWSFGYFHHNHNHSFISVIKLSL